MNEDDIKKANERFEERSGAKVPPPKKTREPLKNGTTCLNTTPRTLSHKATGRSPNRFAMICVPLLPCGRK